MTRAIVLLSGGMDSLLSTAIAANECDELYLLHFSYGQRTEEKEKECFHAIASHYKALEAKTIDYRWLAEIGGSSLTDHSISVSSAVDEIPNSYVPFRNATMLSAAIAWAEVIDATRIYIGAVEEDSSGYPDCREVFFTAMNAVIKYGTIKNNIKIHTPVLHLSKEMIVRNGMELKAPFQLSWSCYVSTDEACGTCPSCLLRLKAFAAAGIEDPIPYRSKA